MTCIIGLAHEGTVYIGCDSAGSNSWTARPVNTPKLIRLGEVLIGYTDSYRMGQILQYHLAIPPRNVGETDEHYLIVSFGEAVRSTLKAQGYTKIDNNTEEGGVFVVGYKGKVYTFQSDFSIVNHADGLEAVGLGEYIALGAMAALESLHPRERILKSLEIVARFQPNGVLPPFHVEAMDS